MAKKRILNDFFTENKCTEEEKNQVYAYLKAIRIVPYIEEIERLFITLKHALNR